MKDPQKPVAPQSLDVAADREGRTVNVEPGKKTLLELKAELEHATGEDRLRLQQEIERLQK